MQHPNQRADAAFERSVAECVLRAVNGFSLVQMRESPDAHLNDDRGFNIGLEITRTVDERVLTFRRRIEASTEAVRREFEASGIRGVFTIYFALAEVDAKPAIHRAWLHEVPRRLATFFAGRPDLILETEKLEAAGITRIARIEWKPAQHTFVGHGWRSRTERGKTLAELVLAKKDERLGRYRARDGGRFREYWLAIASLGPGTIEDGGFAMLLDRRFHTCYDRVFLIFHDSWGAMAEARDITPERLPAR
jgi:hypothetical protein